MRINKENLTQDRVKILWLFWRVSFIFWLYSSRSTWWKDGTGCRKGSIHYQELSQKQEEHIYISRESKKPKHCTDYTKWRKKKRYKDVGESKREIFCFPSSWSFYLIQESSRSLSECRFHLLLLSQASPNTGSSAVQAGGKRGNRTHNKNMRTG